MSYVNIASTHRICACGRAMAPKPKSNAKAPTPKSKAKAKAKGGSLGSRKGVQETLKDCCVYYCEYVLTYGGVVLKTTTFRF